MVPQKSVEDHIRGKDKHRFKREFRLRLKHDRIVPSQRTTRADRTRKYGRGREAHRRVMQQQARIEAREFAADMAVMESIGFGIRSI